MDLAALAARLAREMTHLNALDRKGVLAAPVDLQSMFDGGVVVSSKPTAEKRKGTFIDGSIETESWTIDAPVWVTGDVTVKSLSINSYVVIGGALRADEVVGHAEPYTLTVLGKVTLGHAEMTSQFIMQFLGSGEIGELVDDEEGGEELVQLMRKAGSKLTVKKYG